MDDSQKAPNLSINQTNTISMPLVSIITPVLNRVKYIEECILSVLNQSYPNIEHIFTDGGSTDGTLDILAKYKHEYPGKIIFFPESEDSGPQSAVNKMIQLANGEIIGFLGSDDTLPPDAIEAVVDFYRANPEAFFLFGSCNYMNDQGELVRTVKAREFSLHKIIHGRFYVYGCSMFYKRDLFNKIGLFTVSGEDAITSDLDLLIRAGKTFPMPHIEKVLSNFRMRQWRLSGESWRKSKAYLKSSYIITKRYGASNLSWSARAYFFSNLIDWIRPVFGFTYPLIDKLVEKYRFHKRL